MQPTSRGNSPNLSQQNLVPDHLGHAVERHVWALRYRLVEAMVSHIITWIKSARSLILWPVSGLQFNLGALFLCRQMQKEKFCTSVNNVQLRRNYFSTKFPTHIIRASPRALPVWDFGHDLGRSFRHRIRLVADFAQPTSILQEIVRITKSSSIAPLPNVL